MNKENYDFSCWVIKYGHISVNDLIYQKDCLKFEGEYIVPLIWNYQNWKSDSVLGTALLEHLDEGVYAYCKFNDSESGRIAKELLMNNEELWLGPYVTGVKIDKGYVTHGKIRSVSLIVDRVDPYDCYKPVLRDADKKALDAVMTAWELYNDAVNRVGSGPAFFTIEKTLKN